MLSDFHCDDAALLQKLKNDISNKKTCFEEGDAYYYRSVAVNEQYSFGVRTLAAQLYVRASGVESLEANANRALLCGSILEAKPSSFLKLRSLLNSDECKRDVRLLRALFSTFWRFRKRGELRMEGEIEKSVSFSDVLRSLFFALLSRCDTSEDLRNIGRILSMQRDFSCSARSQFDLIMSFPRCVKEKFALLTFVLPALPTNELVSVERELAQSVWVALHRQPTAIATADCVLAWAQRVAHSPAHSIFPSFLESSLTSACSVRRYCSAQFWLARFATAGPDTLSLMRTAANELARKLLSREASRSGHSTEVLPTSIFQLRELSCAQVFWRCEEDQEVWSLVDRQLYAWLSLVGACVIRGDGEYDSEKVTLLVGSLFSCKPTVRVMALHLLIRLTETRSLSLQDLPNWETHLEHLIVDNLAVDYFDLGKVLCFFVGSSLTNFVRNNERLKRRILLGVEEKRGNLLRCATSMHLMRIANFHPEGDEFWLRISQLAVDEDSAVRFAAHKLMIAHCERIEECHVKVLLSALKVQLSDGAFDDDFVRDLCAFLLHYRSCEWILDGIQGCGESENFTCGELKCAIVVIECGGEKSSPSVDARFVERCFRSSIALVNSALLESGSVQPGECASLPVLYDALSRKSPRESRSPDLFITPSQVHDVNRYYRQIAVSCEALFSLYKHKLLDENSFHAAYDCLWNVLMRSRHKGVVDDTAGYFERMTTICLERAKKEMLEGDVSVKESDTPRTYLKKTMELFTQEWVSTRNLAFLRVLQCLAVGLNCVQDVADFLVANAQRGESPNVAVRALKTLRSFLNASHIDIVSSGGKKIFFMFMDLIRSSDSTIRSAASHCFAVFVSRVKPESGDCLCPLYALLVSHRDLWKSLLHHFLSLESPSDPCALMLLSFIEKFCIVHPSFYSTSQLNAIEELIDQLLHWSLMCSNMRLRRLCVSCAVGLSSDRTKVATRLTKIATSPYRSNKPHSFNEDDALAYAVSRISTRDRAIEEDEEGWPADDLIVTNCGNVTKSTKLLIRERNFLLASTNTLALRIAKTHFYGAHRDRCHKTFADDQTDAISVTSSGNEICDQSFEEEFIKPDVLSDSEVRRLRAAYAISLVLSEVCLPSQLRFETFCWGSVLLMDEVESVSHALCGALASSPLFAARLTYSPHSAIRALFDVCCQQSEESGELVKNWRLWIDRVYVNTEKPRCLDYAFLDGLLLPVTSIV